jgi:formyltetrahydrofolate deformylase
MDAKRRYTLSLSCPDRVGIVAAVSGFLARHQGWIVEASHHADHASARFFMRQEILADSLPFDLDELCRLFAPIADAFGMDWRVTDSAVRHRVVLMVSREDHCLYDLLYRWRAREFGFDVVCVISNHDVLRGFVEWHGIPYHHVPVTPETKPQAFAEVLRLFGEYRGDTLVLARYMQILPPAVCAALPGRIVNIHHSFLPSFAGARPYHQAYARGVKLIGATCHYVTADLDAGPIIEQDTVRVDHGDFVEDLVRYGKDIEKAVLARGLRYHVEGRVLLDASKTVVFR